MKKHQLAAMVLSALSAGILISCTKPSDETQQESTRAENGKQDQTTTAAEHTDDQPNSAATLHKIDLSAQTAQRYLTHVTDSQILPTYENVLQQSRRLNDLATQYCQPSGSINDSEQLAALRAQWLELAKAWAGAEIVNFGPAMDSMSNLYINYYPDERGLVHQGVIDLIAANPTLTAEALSSESAIVQGIPGLEEVLYANESLSAGQCQYVISASGALTTRLENVYQAWSENPAELLGIDESGSMLGMNRWINSILALVETTKSGSLDQPLGLTGHKKGHLPADAAGQSREIINAKLAVLNQALTDPALVEILAENNQDTLSDQMSTQLAEISSLLAELPEDIADATTEQQRALLDKLTELTQVIKHQLMPTLGVQVGFNSTDGD